MSELPDIFLPYQVRWVADKSPVKTAGKSRRIGITWAQAADDVLLAARETNPDDVLYIGYNEDMTREYIDTAADWARVFNKAAEEVEEFIFKDEDKDILTFRIRFANGRKITALSSRPSNLRGKQGRVVIDEAAFHPDLKGLLKAALALLIWGGQVVIISTHNGIDNPFNELIEEILAGKKSYSLHTTTFDDAIRDGLYRRICLRRGIEWTAEGEAEWRQQVVSDYGEDADEELFCIPAKGSGAYLSRNLVQSCMSDSIPVIRWECPAGFDEKPEPYRERITAEWIKENLDPILLSLPVNARHFLGEDFARDGDLTAIHAISETPTLSYLTAFILELRNVPFEQQKQILFHICDRLPKFSGGAMDARGNGQYLAEVAMQRYGPTRIERVMLSQSWYRDNMPPYKAALEDKTFILPLDADILTDHRMIKMNNGVAKVPDTAHTKGSDGKQRHGDTAIAAPLAYYAAMNIEWDGEFEVQTALPRETETAMFRGY